jgi:hypothetical protein
MWVSRIALTKYGVFGLKSGFAVSQSWYAHGWMEPSARRQFEPAGAGGVLLGVLLASIALGALIGWAFGAAGIGALIGAVAGIPLAVYSVYRRYRGVF